MYKRARKQMRKCQVLGWRFREEFSSPWCSHFYMYAHIRDTVVTVRVRVPHVTGLGIAQMWAFTEEGRVVFMPYVTPGEAHALISEAQESDNAAA